MLAVKIYTNGSTIEINVKVLDKDTGVQRKRKVIYEGNPIKDVPQKQASVEENGCDLYRWTEEEDIKTF